MKHSITQNVLRVLSLVSMLDILWWAWTGIPSWRPVELSDDGRAFALIMLHVAPLFGLFFSWVLPK